MKPQEAINIIEDVTWQDNGRHYGKISPAREIAISALEKQIPKKVVKHGFDPNKPISTVHYTCPNCNLHVSRTKHCAYCGQALDWSDTE